MKKILYLLWIITILISCQKTPINGNLDGEWEVMEVYHEEDVTIPSERIFYNFSRNVCQLTFFGGPFTLGNLNYNDNSIRLYFPFIKTENEARKLLNFGIFNNPDTFNVTFESKRDLILYNEEVTVILRKF